jgi:exodeoxyribonuclease V beta subunit
VRVLAPPPGVPFEATWSFSALASGDDATLVEESAAADEAATGQAGGDAEEAEEANAGAGGGDAEHAGLARLAPIAGADFGNAVHAIFERRAVGQPMAAQHALIERCLRDHGVGLRGIALADLVPHLAARVQATLDTPLLPGAGAPTLAALPAHALCTEMPFDFALGTVSLRRLREACPFVPPTAQQTLRGLMTGQVDLVFEHGGRFHVLDYKSNRLGSGVRLSDYDGAALARAMTRDHYRFQALLYTIALDRYLRQRIDGYRRERHLGAAIYLFVRAVGIAPDTAPRAGLWSERFDDTLIDAVDAALAAVEEPAA